MDFLPRVGHYVYTAALVEVTGRGRLPARQIRILPGQSLNEYAKRFFEPHLLDAIPGDLTFAEVISAGKRYRRRDGSWSTMSELVSEAATVWTERVPFAALDAETRRRRSEEHTSELPSLMRISYAVFCLKKKQYTPNNTIRNYCK